MEGFCIILLETPAKLEIALDNLRLRPGELFKGVKEIPFGSHLLCTSLKLGKSSSFLCVNRAEVLVFKWDSGMEEYQRLSSDKESMYEASISEFLPMMVKYEKDSWQAWQELSFYITPETISKLQPVSNQIRAAGKEYDSDPQGFESFGSKKLLFYTTIPKRYLKNGLSPAEITKFNFDKSQILIELLKSEFGTFENVFAEFQFAFLSFLIGENEESFEQWRNLLVLLCNCEEALFTLPDFFLQFVPVLYNQVKNLPKDLIFDPFLSSSFITSALQSFLALLKEPQLPRNLLKRGEKLSNLLSETFCINELEMLNDEEAPIII